MVRKDETASKEFQVDLRHHTPGAAAAVGFDGRQWGMKDLIIKGELPDLLRAKGVISLRGHDQQPFALPVMYLQHVAGKVVHLLKADGNKVLAG